MDAPRLNFNPYCAAISEVSHVAVHYNFLKRWDVAVELRLTTRTKNRSGYPLKAWCDWMFSLIETIRQNQAMMIVFYFFKYFSTSS